MRNIIVPVQPRGYKYLVVLTPDHSKFQLAARKQRLFIAMAFSSSNSVFLLLIFVYFLLLIDQNVELAYSSSAASEASGIRSTSFNFSDGFLENDARLTVEGDAIVIDGVVQIPKGELFGAVFTNEVGRVSYAQPIQLWNATTGEVADFVTRFSFTIQPTKDDRLTVGDGMTFFIAPFSSRIPPGSQGGNLGLVGLPILGSNSSSQEFVAVEFDTNPNSWDPRTSHLGIDVNSMDSKVNVAWNSSELYNGATAYAEVSYSAIMERLSVRVVHPTTGSTYRFSHPIDLRTVLPETVRIGFSAATSQSVEINKILSWFFFSGSGL